MTKLIKGLFLQYLHGYLPLEHFFNRQPPEFFAGDLNFTEESALIKNLIQDGFLLLQNREEEREIYGLSEKGEELLRELNLNREPSSVPPELL